MLDQIKKLNEEYGWNWCKDNIDWMRVVDTLENGSLTLSGLYEEKSKQVRCLESNNKCLENRVKRLESKIDQLNDELDLLKRENKALKDRENLLNTTNHSSHHDNEYHVKVKVGFDEDPDFYTVANSKAYLKNWTGCLQRDSYIYDNDGNKITISVGDDE